MWDLPRPGLEPVSPALAGRLSTTAPPGKPPKYFFDARVNEIVSVIFFLDCSLLLYLRYDIFHFHSFQNLLNFKFDYI